MSFAKIVLYFSFLLKSYNNLQEKTRSILNYLVSLSITKWEHQLVLLGQFQNTIKLLKLLLKKALRSWNIVIEYNWYEWKDKSKIHFVIWIAAVIIIIFLAFRIWTAWLILYLIKNNFVSVKVMLIVWWIVLTRMFWPE